MTTEQEMHRMIGSVLWATGEMFIGNMIPTSEEEVIGRDHPRLVVKTLDGSEFQITIVRSR